MAEPPLPPLGPPATALAHGFALVTTSLPEGSGWFYDLLLKAGVSPDTAKTVVDFVIRPLGILLVVALAVVVAIVGAHFIRRALGRVAAGAATRSRSPRAEARFQTLVAVSANLWRFFVLVVTLFVVLGMLGIDLTPVLASATVIGAVVAFGAQTLVRDYLSGFLLTLEDQFGIGDTISVNETTGTVENVSLRVTVVRAFDGTLWYLPNGDIRKLANRSRGRALAVVDLVIAPGSTEALEQAKTLVGQAAAAVAEREPHVAGIAPSSQVVGVTTADGATATVRVTVTTTEGRRDAVERAVREAALGSLAEHGLWPGAAPA